MIGAEFAVVFLILWVVKVSVFSCYFMRDITCVCSKFELELYMFVTDESLTLRFNGSEF